MRTPDWRQGRVSKGLRQALSSVRVTARAGPPQHRALRGPSDRATTQFSNNPILDHMFA